MPPSTVPSRCWTAIYTRQLRSSAGDFSSCEAQQSACLAFVMARLGDGWVWNGKRRDLLRRIVQEVVFHAGDGTVSVTLDSEAVEQFCGHAPTP